MIDQITVYIAGAIVAALIAGFGILWGRVQAFTETHAAPRREKDDADLTLTDKLIIEADRRADMLNIEQYEVFLTNFVAMHINDILRKAPVVGPMVVAADYVDDMLASLTRRNPDLAGRLNQSRTTAQEKLAGEIGKVVKDNLTRDLLVAGAPAVEPKP